MKRILVLTISVLLLATPASAKIRILGRSQMIQGADLIAIVNIQGLTQRDKTVVYGSLDADAHVVEFLKGTHKGRLAFTIPRAAPCGAFDVSTGRHLVFLTKNKQGTYAGENWYMSYIYLSAAKTRWYGENNSPTADVAPAKILEEVRAALTPPPAKK